VFEVVDKLPWNVAKDGPLVAPIPLRMATGATLDDIDRRKAIVGGLTAIVPKTMATVDSRFTNAPNLYEGLPRDAKVLYLLRSLSASQWSKATGDGLSVGDCQGEQRAVFESIVPNPLRYSMGTVTDSRGITNPNGPGEIKTMSSGDRAKVKLRVVRHLHVRVSMENNGGWSITEPEGDMKPGTTMPLLTEDEDSEFGHQVIVRGPNVPRKSHLDLQDPRLDKPVAFKSGERLANLLERIGTASGLRFVADPHYAPMLMVERGTAASARDLLAALSLGVAGTYRRVGGTYVLTADLEGMAAHAVRVGVWEDALEKVVEARSNAWRQQIARGGGLSKIQFSSPAYEGLTETEKANLEANDRPSDGPHFIPIDQASKPVRDAIKNWKFGNRIDRERAGVSSSIRYDIVLPGTGRTWWQGWLGNTEEYRSEPYVWTPPNPPPVALPLDPQGGVTGIVLHADTPAQAKAQVARVARLGVGELWLETRDAAALKAAVEAAEAAKVRVALAVRPWEIPAGATVRDPDRTVTGEFGRTLAASKLAIEPWANFWQDIQTFEPPTRSFLAPVDPSTSAVVASLAQLARTPGLAKVVVLDLYPTGYGKTETDRSGSYWYSVALDAYLAYGYAEAMREAYLNAEGVDPIDLETRRVHSNVDLNPAWGLEFTLPQGFDKWQATKGKWHRDRAVALAMALRNADPSLPILMPGEPPVNHLPPSPTPFLYRWEGRGELPVAPADYGGGSLPEGAEVRILDLIDDRDPAQRNRVANRLKEMLDKRKKPVVLDLSSVPEPRMDAVLAGWLRGPKPPQP
jgi:hypothetical protein